MDAREPKTPLDSAIDNDEKVWRDERHRRRLVLMRAEGDINRMETRVHVLWGIVLVLGVVALILSAL
jgi:hypothetical protein